LVIIDAVGAQETSNRFYCALRRRYSARRRLTTGTFRHTSRLAKRVASLS
jgi:hypothetical protein